MPLVKPASPPGFNAQATQVQAAGGWFDGNLIRWRLGYLEKMKGWRRLFEDPFIAIIRKMHAWLDLDNRKNLLVATDLGLQLAVQKNVLSLGHQIVLTDARFSATAGATEVTVTAAALVKVGDSLTLQLPISIGGQILDSGTSYTIVQTAPGNFVFEMPLPANYTETNAIGIRLFTNDIPNAMTVTWRSHGLAPGASITFAQDTLLQVGTSGVWEEVNFFAPSGTVVVVDAVPSGDTFTFQMGSLGEGDGAGGPTHQVYDGAPAGMVASAVALTPSGNPQRINWFLDNLGQNGLALHTGGPLQVYNPPIENGPWITTVGVDGSAPQRSNGMFVAMPQAQVILVGTEPIMGSGDIDPLLVRWSDAGTYDVWSATVANQAGSYRLSRGSLIVGGIQAPQTTLLVTDTDIWAMSYIGPPLIYGFTVMGTGCGLIAEDAIESIGRSTYWMSTQGFWQFGDGGVQPLPCSVYDYVFNDIDQVNVGKIFAAANSTTHEIAWFFPSKADAVQEEDQNLLFFSQQFTEWTKIGAEGVKDTRFREEWEYEPQYLVSGWFDDIGLNLVAWLNDDLQGILENVILAPDGTDTAMVLREFAVSGMHGLSQTVNNPDEKVTYTFSVYAHDSSLRNITLRAASPGGSAYATFNVALGTVVSQGATSPTFSLINARVITDDVLDGNGWLRYALTFLSDDGPEFDAFINLTQGTAISYLGDRSKGALIWGAQLVLGNDVQDYRTVAGIVVQNECTHYVKYNTVERAWDKGKLWRSAWIDNNVWGTALGADESNRVQQHEQGYDADDQPMRDVFAETGYTELGDGSTMLSIDEVHPDLNWFGDAGVVRVTLKAVNYPGGPVRDDERYPMTPTTQFFKPRIRARYAAIRYEWAPQLGFSARVGATTFRVKQAGRRP